MGKEATFKSLSLNSLTSFSKKPLGKKTLSASKNKNRLPLAIFAPSFLPLAGNPPFTILHSLSWCCLSLKLTSYLYLFLLSFFYYQTAIYLAKFFPCEKRLPRIDATSPRASTFCKLADESDRTSEALNIFFNFSLIT